MKMILSAAIVLGLCGIVRAEDAKAGPVGTWKLEYQIGDQKRTAELTIKQDGDKLAGTMNWPDQKDTELKDVKLKDGEISFSAVREFQNNKFTVDYKLKIDGDNIKGKASVDTGNEKREIEIDGKRAKK